MRHYLLIVPKMAAPSNGECESEVHSYLRTIGHRNGSDSRWLSIVTVPDRLYTWRDNFRPLYKAVAGSSPLHGDERIQVCVSKVGPYRVVFDIP